MRGHHAESPVPVRGRGVRQRSRRPAGVCAIASRSYAYTHRLRHRRHADGRRPALHRHVRVQGSQADVHVQLLPDQARRRIHGVGHRLRTWHKSQRAESRHRRSPEGAQGWPEQVKYVGISHFHGDHTGQLAPFTNATLLIGKGDWDGITAPTPMQGANVAGFKSWISESRKVEPLTVDKDVFGDGSVIVLRTPGHTPGHSSLLVGLKEMGPVLLTGDLVHFRENYESGGVPSFNFDRAATVASIERMKQIAANLKATVVIQHDMRDIGKLPPFPAAAK